MFNFQLFKALDSTCLNSTLQIYLFITSANKFHDGLTNEVSILLSLQRNVSIFTTRAIVLYVFRKWIHLYIHCRDVSTDKSIYTL